MQAIVGQQRAIMAKRCVWSACGVVGLANYVRCKENPYWGSMITSKLTTKAQTTIPQPVRSALNLKPGDELCYEIQGKRVILAKARRRRSEDDPFKTFYEWDSEADRRAYGDL